MFYGLSKNDIEEIIKEGKFDEDKWSHKLAVLCYTTEDIANSFEEKTEAALKRMSEKELYDRIYEEVQITDYSDQGIWDDFSDYYYDIAYADNDENEDDDEEDK